MSRRRMGYAWARAGWAGALLGLFIAAAAGGPARADDPEYLTFGAGAFDISGDDGTGMVSLEYTDDRQWIWALKPMTGAFVTLDGALYGYAGLALDIYFGKGLVVTPSFAPGLYMKNGGADLGHPIEFRSSVKLAWRFEDRSRLGLDLSHLSNAGLDEHNPGANQLMLFYSVPFTRGGN